MKARVLKILVLIVLGVNFGYSQNKNEVRAFYSIFLDKPKTDFLSDMAGGPTYEFKSYSEFGVQYLRNLSEHFRLETGVNYFYNNILVSNSSYEQIKLLSIPLYANYTFGKYAFVNGGPILDLHLFKGKSIFKSPQSGIGFGIGTGGKYDYHNFSFYLNPMLKIHSVVPFSKNYFTPSNTTYDLNLMTFTIQLGVGYKF